MRKNSKDMALVKTVAERLQKARKEKGMTLKDIAFETDLELTQVHRLVHGSHDPQLTNIAKVAKALEIKLSDLFEEL